jgi:uncharacterized repeat protein (TIGR03943 family)
MVNRAFHALSAALLALVLAVRLADGSFTALVQTWYEPLLLGSVAVLLICAVAVGLASVRAGGSWRPAIGPGGALTVVAIAASVALGLTFKPAPLDSSNLESDPGVDVTAFSATAAEDDPLRRNVYQWAYVFASQDPADIIGLQASVVGFVHHPADGLEGGFEVARFVVACCVADARGYTLPVAWEAAADLPANAWVRVSGSVRTDPAGAPVIAATAVEIIDAPSNPYIYP